MSESGRTRSFFFFVLAWFLTPGLIFLGSIEYKIYAAIVLTVFTTWLLASMPHPRFAGRLLFTGVGLAFLSMAPNFMKMYIGRALVALYVPVDTAEYHHYVPPDPQGTFFVCTISCAYFELKPTNKIFDSKDAAPFGPEVRYLLAVDDPALLESTHWSKPLYPLGFNPSEWAAVHRPNFKLGKISRYFITYPLLRECACTVYQRIN